MQSHTSDLLTNTYEFLKEHSSLPLSSSGVTASVSSSWESSTSSLHRVSLENHQHGNLPTSVICKVVNQKFMVLGVMEIHFYKVLAPSVRFLDVPKFWNYVVDNLGTVYLFLEDLELRATSLHSAPSSDIITTVIKTIARFHATFWQTTGASNALPDLAPSTADVTRAPTAVLSTIHRHSMECKEAVSAFLSSHSTTLSEDAKTILAALSARWEDRFVARVTKGNITIIHGDLHPLGNVWVTKTGTPVIIDWAQIKLGLGPHDIMYLLLSLQTDNRIERDTGLLRMYYEELIASGKVSADYSFDQCLWDFKFSLVTNLFQSIFQNSFKWFNVNLKVIKEWNGCMDVLTAKF
jgi:hypothetical protein